VIYEGQEAKAASENFLVDIGDGEAMVAVQAKQNWGPVRVDHRRRLPVDQRDVERGGSAGRRPAGPLGGQGGLLRRRHDHNDGDAGDDPVTSIRFAMGRLYDLDSVRAPDPEDE
jgi:hypothetical protein